MFIDIPSDKLMPSLLEGVEKQLKNTMLPEIGYLEIDRIEWTAEGLRIWMLTKK